jgi:DNA-binding transcriptional LysR family regulator
MLEVKLFDRLPRGVRPTWYGETMIRHARMALASLSQAHDEIDALKAGRFGQVSIGSITAPAITLLPDAVAPREGGAPEPAHRAPGRDERRADGAPRAGQAGHGHRPAVRAPRQVGLRYQALVEEPVAAVVRPGHPLMEVTSLTLRDLVGAGWIIPPAGSVLRHRFELMFQEEGLDTPGNLIETTALLFMTRMLGQSDLSASSPPTSRCTTRSTGCARSCRSSCPARWTPSG